MNKIVKWLREEQKRIQTEFKKKIPKQKIKQYDLRGVWIALDCVCGYRLRTPHHIRDNGQCPECGKRFCRADNKDIKI